MDEGNSVLDAQLFDAKVLNSSESGEPATKKRLMEPSLCSASCNVESPTKGLIAKLRAVDDDDIDEELDGDLDEDEEDEDEEDTREDEDEEEEEEDDDASHLPLEEFEDDENEGAPGTSRAPTPSLEREREAKKMEDRKLLALMAHFNDDQLNRFEMFRRATFNNPSVRRLIQSVAPCTFTKKVVIAMAGITKVFVGELIEAALDYKDQLKETGPLQPKHIRVAYIKLQAQQRTSRLSRFNPARR